MATQAILPGMERRDISEKIYLAEKEIIRQYERNNGNLFISFSGGKDSTVLRDIALRLYPDLPVVFSNTTNELAEVVKFVKTIPGVISVMPKMNFKAVVNKYGFPLVSKETSAKADELSRTNSRKLRMKRSFGDEKGNGKLADKWQWLSSEVDFKVTAQCCKILKKDPLEKWAKKQPWRNGEGYGLKPIIALMGDESNLRQQLALYGEDDGKKVYPFLKTGWEEEDIWAYHDERYKDGFRFAECYYDKIVNGFFIKARKRTGCEYCAFGITLEKEDRFERSKKVSPKRYEKMMAIENNGTKFIDAITMVRNNNIVPKLGIPGVLFQKKDLLVVDKKKTILNHAVSTTITKKCIRCESKNLKKSFGHYGNYSDIPDEKGVHRRVFVNSENGYDCLDCGAVVVDDLHLFDPEFCATARLVKYIEKNIKRKGFHEIVEKTGIDFDMAFDIAERFLKKQKINAEIEYAT